MTPTIEMKPLSQTKRRIVFLLSLLLFIVAVPFSVFYAIGYRFDFTDELSNIKSVGGMYVRNETEGTEMFINDEPVEDMRVFQKASYIQNLEAGMHRLHVQGNGVQTWVKNLPVYAHFVTEVTSFNLPTVPQIRLITQWSNPVDNRGIVFDTATSTYFNFASTTAPVLFSSTTATTSWIANPEFAYVSTLVASSTEIKDLLEAQEGKNDEEPFSFRRVSTSTTARLTLATTTRTWRDFTLFEKGEEVFISYEGSPNDIPYYYCVLYGGQKKTTSEYGAHVYEALKEQIGASSNLAGLVGERVCRNSIRIDRLDQEVLWFDFYPDSADLILMHLQDGLYAVEVDDRAWQNTQLIYPGNDLEIVQDGGRIYVKDGEYYLEVFTEIAAQ